MTAFSTSENDRRVSNVLSLGKVTAVHAGSARADVQVASLAIPNVLVGQLRAGPLSFWWMPQVGEQVLIGAPSGDLAQAVILCSIFAGNQPSSDGAVPMIDLDGGKLQINGDLEITGGITTTEDVVARTVSLLNHTHGGIVRGGSSTNRPNQ